MNHKYIKNTNKNNYIFKNIKGVLQMKKGVSILLSFIILLSSFVFNFQIAEAANNKTKTANKALEDSMSVSEYVYEENPLDLEEELFNFAIVEEFVYEKPNPVITEISTVHEDIQDYKLVPFTVHIENMGGMTRKDIQLTWKMDGKTIGTTSIERGMFPYERRTSTLEWRAVPGNHTLTVIVDDRNLIEEEDETDNIFEKDVFVREAVKLNLARYSTERPFTQTLDAGRIFSVGIKKDGKIIITGNTENGRSGVSSWEDIIQISSGDGHIVGLKGDGSVVAAGYNGNDNRCNVVDWKDIVQVSAGDGHTVGLKSDGTVVAVGKNKDNQCSVEDWEDIVQISAGESHTVALKSDGSVVAVGNNGNGKCNVEAWEDIVQVSAGLDHTVALKRDGTVIAVGSNQFGQCDVEEWSEVVHIWAGNKSTIAVRKDGSVLYCGNNKYGQANLNHWTDIVQAFSWNNYVLGLKKDGSIVAVGDNRSGQCNFAGVEWKNMKDIIQISAGTNHTVGLRSDGSVVAVGSNSNGKCDVESWEDIVQVAAGEEHTVGLRKDGRVVAVGSNSKGQCNVEDWEDIVYVSVGSGHTVGLRADGKVLAVGYSSPSRVTSWQDIIQVSAKYLQTIGLQRDGKVVATGNNYYGQCNVGALEDIIQISAGTNHTLVLKNDGTVLAVGRNYDRECNVSAWQDIIQVSAGNNYSIGLTSDGRVVTTDLKYSVEDWEDIVEVSAGDAYVIGLKRNGELVGVGDNTYGQSKEILPEILSVPELFREEAFALEVTDLNYSFDDNYDEEDYCDGMDMTINAEITNKGNSLIDTTAVLFKLDDNIVGSRTINNFQPGEKRIINITCPFDAGAKNLIVIPDNRFPDEAIKTMPVPYIEKTELNFSVEIEKYRNRFIIHTNVTNEGTRTIRNVDIDYLLDGKKIGTGVIKNGIKSGETKYNKFEFYADAGSHILTVRLDPNNNIPEQNEENNEYTEEIMAETVPSIRFINLEKGQMIFSPYKIEYNATSQLYNPNELKISISLINGEKQIIIAKDIENTGFYDWTYSDIPEGKYQLKITAIDPKGNESYAEQSINIIKRPRIEIKHNEYEALILDGDEAKIRLLIKNLQATEDTIDLFIEKDVGIDIDIENIYVNLVAWEEKEVELAISYDSYGIYYLNILARSQNNPLITDEETVELAVFPTELEIVWNRFRRLLMDVGLF